MTVYLSHPVYIYVNTNRYIDTQYTYIYTDTCTNTHTYT